MKTLSMVAQKGGTGKTTLTIHLAVQARLSGLRVLLIDVDPQASASAWWRRRREDQPALIQRHGGEVAAALKTAADQGYDLVVVDTAPHSSAEATTCARLSDLVYIPTRPAILDLDAIGASTKLVTDIGVPARVLLNACPPPTIHGEPQLVAEARQALGAYGTAVCEVAVSQRAAFSHALIDGRAVTEFDRKGKAALEIERLWNIVRGELKL